MSITFIKENKTFLLLTLIFIGYFSLTFSAYEKLLANFADDAFYYFKTASNIANGLGPTFDGENLTNGYHPLWMGVNVLIYYLIPNDRFCQSALFWIISAIVFRHHPSYLENYFQWSSDKWIQALAVFGYALNP